MAKKECKIIKYSEMLEYVINELVQYTLEYDFWKEIKGDALVDEIIESTWFDVEEFEEHPLGYYISLEVMRYVESLHPCCIIGYLSEGVFGKHSLECGKGCPYLEPCENPKHYLPMRQTMRLELFDNLRGNQEYIILIFAIGLFIKAYKEQKGKEIQPDTEFKKSQVIKVFSNVLREYLVVQEETFDEFWPRQKILNFKLSEMFGSLKRLIAEVGF